MSRHHLGKAGFIVALALGVGLSAQSGQAPRIPNLAGKVLTVNGPIDPSAVGTTLMHEHIFIEFRQSPPMVPPPTGITVLKPPPPPPDPAAPAGRGRGAGGGGLTDFDESLAEIMEFKKIGGGTIVDTTNFGLTRDPEALLRASKASGLHVVMGAGWYQKGLHPPDMTERTVEELTDIIVRDVTVGAQGTNIRSGIIGEVGIQPGRDPLSENEIKSARASARAARITGAPITVHSFGTPEQMLQTLDIFASEGVDASRVVMGHSYGKDLEYLKTVARRGGYIEFDYFGQAPLPPARDAERIDAILNMINLGYADKLLLAHDVCTKPQLKKNGGGGYTYISNVLVPGLKAKGVGDDVIKKIMVDNPRRVLTFAAPQPPVAQKPAH